MIRERVAENVYVFSSEIYAQVNAGAVVGSDWSVLIDTLAYPEESQEIRDFLEGSLNSPVRYLINTHYHTDHSLGNCWFPKATILSHALCREYLDTRGRKALKTAQAQNRDLRKISIRLPDVVFDEGSLSLRIGKRTIQLLPLPGHSGDGIGALVVEDRVLFSGDIMMPVPTIVDGDFEDYQASLKRIPRLKLENLVQGHGDVILRGEINSSVKANSNYLNAIRKHVRKAARRKDPISYLEEIDIESCGKNRILLNGLAEALHQRNMVALLRQWYPDKEF